MEKEQIQLYYAFHLHVKSSLIQQISNDSTCNVQIGCEPYDIHIWDRHYNSKLLCVDNNPHKVQQISQRFKKSKCKKDFKFEVGLSYPVVNNIAIPYFGSFCVTLPMLTSMMETISNRLQNGGYFVGMVVDGDSVLELLAGNHFFKNNIGFVKKLYFDCNSKIGHSIKIGLPNKLFLNERTIETHYICYKDVIVSIANSHNLELVYWKPFHKYQFPCKRHISNEYKLVLELFSSFMFKKLN